MPQKKSSASSEKTESAETKKKKKVVKTEGADKPAKKKTVKKAVEGVAAPHAAADGEKTSAKSKAKTAKPKKAPEEHIEPKPETPEAPPQVVEAPVPQTRFSRVQAALKIETAAQHANAHAQRVHANTHPAPQAQAPAQAPAKPAAAHPEKPKTTTTHAKPAPAVVKPAEAAKPAVEHHKPAVKHVEHKATAAPAAHAAHAPAAKPVEKPVVKTTQHHAPAAAAPAAQSAPAPQAVPVQASAQTAPAAPPEPPKPMVRIKINEMITVRELAEVMRQKPGDLIKKLISMGSLATINQRLDRDIAILLAHEFNYEAVFASIFGEEAAVEEKEDPKTLKPRPPIVTIMGHVDHGKTSLLDAIRSTSVAKGEAGGITQHIGAYSVVTPKGEITFLDTPGHEAFTAMRSRGAKVTDLVVLVVSASDGVMPQTIEAIDHSRAAGVPIIVAINKIDIAGANPEQIKQELNKYSLVPESWGGDTIMVEVSAKKNLNIDQLLDMILLKAELMELKANPDRTAKGAVVEAKLDPKRGPVATVLVQTGTLHISDNFVVGTTLGKVRAMVNDRGQRLTEVLPGRPVEVLGLSSAPQAGDQFIVVADERIAREIAQSRQNRTKEDAQRPRHHLSLEDISTGKAQDLRVIVKADVQGSLGALRDSLEKLSTSEINLKIIHGGVGSVNESDVTLAAASDAMIIGFNIRPDASAQKIAEKEGVNIRTYRIIYDVIDEIRAAMEGLLTPELKEVVIGKAVVRQIFKSSKAGMIAGCKVTEGKIQRNSHIRLLRDNKIVYDGTIASLRHLKDDVKEVDKDFECGIALEKYTDLRPGDVLEAFINEKISRKLEG